MVALTEIEISNLRIALKRVAFLEHLKIEELDLLIGALAPSPFQAGEIIIKQGERGRTFYLIADGSVTISRRRLFRTTNIATRRAGEFVGEMALLKDEPRNATVTGEIPGKVYGLSREAFDAILLKNPSIATMVRKTAADRRAEDQELGK